MFSAYIRNYSRHAAAGLLATLLLAAQSCVREPDLDPREEGREAAVTLRWSPSDMTIQSRALTDEQERHVHSLWVGIYDYGSGKIKTLTVDKQQHTQGYYITPDATLKYHELDPQAPLNIHTTSGESYIVAVANPDTNYGISSRADMASDPTSTTLLDLLRQCDTWEKFRSVAALTGAITKGTTPNITLTEANMPMVGLYHETLDHNEGNSDPVDWTEEARSHTYIPAGATTLPGTIHLRRLHAYVDFQIIPGTNITVEPISWQVHNIPYASYLHERAADAPEGQNAGDDDAFGKELYGDDYRDNYAPSRLSRIFEPRNDLGTDKKESGVQFSFYQFENKHTALEKSGDADDYTGVATYKDREREWKNDAAQNTGIYKSLTADLDGDANNMATYVEIQAKVTYYVKGQNDNGTGGQITSENDPDAKPRMGFATYVIHLGYCEDKTGANTPTVATARDFNCRRNTRYTYTVRINGLNDIVVEAVSDATPANDTPGVEGDVTDYEGKSVIELDAHYGVFNIEMSNDERTNLYWRIKAPYDGGYHVLSFADYEEIDAQKEDRTDPFYNWIRFKPTSNEKVLATYRDNGIDDTKADEALWTLEDLRDVEKHPHSSGATDPQDKTQRWYTVFIDEHAYLLDEDGKNTADWKDSDWTKYVNQDDRIAWLIVDKDGYKISPDGESIYSNVKYLISQRSIQTYYSTDKTNKTHTALGVEHFNETFGKNLTWTWQTNATSQLSHSNGRWNTWKYLTQSTWSTRYDWSQGTTLRWNAVVNSTVPDATYPVAALVSTTDGKTRSTGSEGSSDPDPGGAYYEILAACMSRNRDLNGDGEIDESELKWYLPAEGKYERIMLGRNALRSWLFNPTQEPWYTTGDDPYAQQALNNKARMTAIQGEKFTKGVTNWVHYVSSDYRKFFTDEGGSWFDNPYEHWSSVPEWGVKNGRWAWNIRCVRNLGASMATVTASAEQDPVERAYSYDSATRIFDASSYADDCLRAPIQTYLPVHTIRDLDRNLIARKFEVATADAVVDNVPTDQLENYMNANRPCRDYEQNGDKERWRIPNQREMMMILSQGLLDENEHWSCTKEAYAAGTRFAITTKVLTMKVIDPDTKYTLRVRCVRDVE